MSSFGHPSPSGAPDSPDQPGRRDPATALVFSRDLSGAFGADMRLRRLVDRGILHRLNRGQYVETREWNALERSAG